MIKKIVLASVLSVAMTSCTALDALTALTPSSGMDISAAVQVAENAESTKNKIESNVDSRTNISAKEVNYTGMPWYAWVMVFLAYMVKDPFTTWWKKELS